MGTSASCPHVVGTAALVLAHFGPLSPAEVRIKLKDAAEWLPNLTVEQQGAGLVDTGYVIIAQRAPCLHRVSSIGKVAATWGKLKSR